LDSTDPLKKISISFGNDNSSEDVTMSPEIFCCGVQDQISAEIEWPLDYWRPGIIANENRSGIVRDFSERREINDF
jgi:hypothetical protein